MSFTASTPPQPDRVRVHELARLQLAGFYYVTTYDAQKRRGGFWPGVYKPLLFSFRGDWGNSVYRWFIAVTREWHLRFWAELADDYYKIVLRRNPDSALWSWAMEWNRNLRIIGFLGEEDAVTEMVARAPELETFAIGDSNDGGHLRVRSDVPLPKESDQLFFVDQ